MYYSRELSRSPAPTYGTDEIEIARTNHVMSTLSYQACHHSLLVCSRPLVHSASHGSTLINLAETDARHTTSDDNQCVTLRTAYFPCSVFSLLFRAPLDKAFHIRTYSCASFSISLSRISRVNLRKKRPISLCAAPFSSRAFLSSPLFHSRNCVFFTDKKIRIFFPSESVLHAPARLSTSLVTLLTREPSQKRSITST